MKPETAEWVKKAEGDIISARREMAAGADAILDTVCFHAQQCAEKYLKAMLVEAGHFFRKIHDLEALLDLVLVLEPDWEHLRSGLRDLTDMAVEVRYPGFEADTIDATQALAVAEEIRLRSRSFLDLENAV